MRAVAILVVALWPTAADALSPLSENESAVLQEGLITTADAFILPAYEAHAEAAGTLRTALSRYCAGEGEIERAQSAFTATFLAWQRSSIIQFGPVAEAEGPMRVQLWPDPKGFARRAVRAAVRLEDPQLLDVGGLEGRSIALTGLTALELLLYQAPAPGTYGCSLALAIGEFQADLADDLVAAWTPGSAFRRDYDTAADGNARYPNVDAVMRAFLAGTVVYVDRLRKFKLLRGLGTVEGEARPERTEAQLSEAGLQSIAASFRALADLYAIPFGVFDVAPDIGGSMTYFTLGETAASIADTLAAETAPLSEIAAADGAKAAELRRFAELLVHQESFLKAGFLDAIGLSAGFTAADGD